MAENCKYLAAYVRSSGIHRGGFDPARLRAAIILFRGADRMRQEGMRAPSMRWNGLAKAKRTAFDHLGFTLQPTDFDDGSVGVLT
jgi:hypothetical protein